MRFCPLMPLRAMSGSMVLLQLGVARVTNKGQVGIFGLAATGDHYISEGPYAWGTCCLSGLYCHLRPWEHLGSCCSWEVGQVWEAGSVLIYQVHVTTQGYADVPGLDCHLRHGDDLVSPLTWAVQ